MRGLVSMLLAAGLAGCASPRDATPGNEREAQPTDAPASNARYPKPHAPIHLARATMIQPTNAVRVSQPAPERVQLERGSSVTVPPLKWVDYRFEVPRAGCRLTGHLQGIAGGERDFEAFVLDDDNLQAWKAGLTPNGASSGRGEKWAFATKVAAPGPRHLLVSNRFSEFTPKIVKVWAAMDCPAA